MAGLRRAVECLVDTNPDGWLAWASQIGECEIQAAQRLVAHGFTQNPGRYATSALAFLLEDPRRFMLGSNRESTSTSERLISVASTHWSDEEIREFEAAIAAYKPSVPSNLSEPIERRNWTKHVRHMKLTLLRALPGKHRLALETQRQVQAEERAFPEANDRIRFTGATVIGSIMDAAAMARSADADIINAFRTLPDAAGWSHPRNFMLGRQYSKLSRR